MGDFAQGGVFMPGYTQKGGKTEAAGVDATQILTGGVATPCGHDDPIEDTRPGLPKPMDKPEHQYTANESHPSMDRGHDVTGDMDNHGSYAKKFTP